MSPSTTIGVGEQRAGGGTARPPIPRAHKHSGPPDYHPGRIALVATLALLGSTALSPGTALSAPGAIRANQPLTTLLSSHEAFSRPSDHSLPLGLIQARRPLTGEQTVLPVLAITTATDGTRWLHVRLPGRPNNHTGWIQKHATRPSTTSWHLVVDTSIRRLTIYHDGFPIWTLEAIVGKPSTPTPHGQFFVEENVHLQPTDPGAPFALALSARSYTLGTFDGGPGQIALHGLENLGGTLGTAASHGCIRLANTAISWLAARIGPGVPVTITS